MKKINIALLSFLAILTLGIIAHYLYLHYQGDSPKKIERSVKKKRLETALTSNKTAIIFYSEKGDQEKHFRQIIQALQPDEVIMLSSQTVIQLPKGDYAYVIFTGDHGDIANGQPTHFNGMPIQAFRNALQASSFTAKLLILDTCFGAACIPDFIAAGVLNEGSKAIVTLGECQGFSAGMIASYQGKKIKDTFIPLLNGLERLGSKYNAISLYEYRKNGGILYTRFYQSLEKALGSARFLGIKDQQKEIVAMTSYLTQKGIKVKKVTKKKLLALFQEKLQEQAW